MHDVDSVCFNYEEGGKIKSQKGVRRERKTTEEREQRLATMFYESLFTN